MNGDSLRYERKFAVATPSVAAVRHVVKHHPAMFRVLFPPRDVNNIYLDTPALAAAHHNLEGMPDRWKARIRWYGEFFGTVTGGALETKRKYGSVGSKDRFLLESFEVAPGLNRSSIRTTIDAAGLDSATAAAVAMLEPSLANRYHREYYATPDRRYRVTIDSELTNRAIGSRRTPVRRRNVVIVELKYERKWDSSADEISAMFPFRLSRFSKYADGLEQLGI